MSDSTRSSPFRHWLDLLRVELEKAIGRRAFKFVALITLAMLIWLSWSNYKALAEHREEIRSAQRAIEDPNSRDVSIREGFRGRYPYFGSEVTKEEYRSQLESFRSFSVLHATVAKHNLQLANSHRVILGFFGTVPGVLLAVLVASTFFGAEFRWGYWKTSATHEPRRGRLIVAKLGATWLILGIGLSGLLALSYGPNAIFAEIYGLQEMIPSLDKVDPRFQQTFSKQTGFSPLDPFVNLGAAWLSIGTYATFAIAAVIWARTTLAGPLASVGLLVLDGTLITPRLLAVRHVSPAQQIAFLLPDIPFTGFQAGKGIWYERMDRIVSFSGTGMESVPNLEMLSNIPDWRALLVLAGWIVAAAGVAVIGLRARDLPG